jgi:hypothetical protein
VRALRVLLNNLLRFLFGVLSLAGHNAARMTGSSTPLLVVARIALNTACDSSTQPAADPEKIYNGTEPSRHVVASRSLPRTREERRAKAAARLVSSTVLLPLAALCEQPLACQANLFGLVRFVEKQAAIHFAGRLDG